MSRWKTPAAGICVCFLVVIALLTILFVVMNKHPEKKIDLSSTDMRIIDKVSSVWCGWQEVSSSHPITVYRITGEPTYDRSEIMNYHLNYDIKLRWGRERELRYYLLSGSSVEINACSNQPGIFLSIFQGLHRWKACKSKKVPFHYDTDSSSSEESDEERWGKNSLKDFLERKLSRHSWYPPDCKEAMQSHEIPSVKNKCKRSRFSLKIGSPGTYIFSIEAYHNSAEESNTNIKISLNRTRYQTEHGIAVCTETTLCDVPLSFGSDERSVVAVSEEADAGAVTYMVVAKCKPRVFFFIFLFAFIPLLLLLCSGCIIFCLRRRGKKNVTVKYIQVGNNEQPNTPDLPLLSGPEVTLYSRTDRYNRPPAYPESSAPPPYAPTHIPNLTTNLKGNQ